MGTFFRAKTFVSVLLFFFMSGSVYPQQASTVSDAVSPVGQEARASSVNVGGVDPNAALIRADLNPYNFTVPEDFGNIEEIFQGSNTSPLIVYIQNVHANYEAQVNIKKILAHLVEKYQFNLIQLEGAVSKLNPEVLQPSYLKEANLKLVDFLMREGRITGADAFSVETDKPVELYGIEDYGFYAENLKMFKSVYKHQPEVSAYFNEVHRLIQNIGPKLLSPELLDFTRKTEEFAADKIDFFDYLLYMNQLSEKHGLTSLGELKEMANYPNLVRIMRLHNLEKQLNKNGLKNEVASIKAEFGKRIPGSKEVEEVMAKLEQNEKGTAPREYFLKLTKLADEAKIDFISYPALRIFAEFLIHQDEVDHRGLFQELKQFEGMLQEKLFTKDDEKALLQVIGFVGLLEQYFRLEMSREKLILYLKDRDQVKPSWIASELMKLAEEYQIAPKTFGDLAKLDAYMGEVEYFYQLVLKRDEVFLQKVFAQMKASGEDKTVLITGGFHKDGLIDHFRKEKISYIIVNPKVNVKEGNENYLKVMLEDDAVVGSVFAGTFAVEIVDYLDNAVRTPAQNWFLLSNAAASSAVTRGLDQALSAQDFARKMNERFSAYQSITDKQIFAKVVDAREVSGRFIHTTIQGQLLIKGRVHEFELEAAFDSERQSFEVKSETLKFKPTVESLKINPTIKSQISQLVSLQETIPAPLTFPTTVVSGQDLRNSFILREFVPTPDVRLPSPVIGALSDRYLSAEQLVQLFALEGVTAESVKPIVGAREGVITEEVIEQAVAQVEGDQALADRSKRMNLSISHEEPRVLALVSDNIEGTVEDRRSELRELALAIQDSPNALAIVYGSQDTTELIKAGIPDVDQNVWNRVKVFPVANTREALALLEEHLQGGRIYKVYLEELPGVSSPKALRDNFHIRAVRPPQAEFGYGVLDIPGVNILQIISQVGSPEAQKDRDLRLGLVRVQLRGANAFPTSGDINAALLKYGLEGFLVAVEGINAYGVPSSMFLLVKKLELAQQIARQIARMA